MAWPLVTRNALDQVMDILAGNDFGGVALLGNEGVGKTTLAAQAAERLGLGDPVWVIGTLAQSSVPFGAFGQLLEIHAVGKPAEMLSAAAESLLAQADSAPIIVDNARLLDPLSASLVYRLAKEAGPTNSRMIVTVRSVLRVPRVVSALWDDGLLARLDLPPMDGAETTALVEAAGGSDAATLYRRTAGNPLHLRLLLSTDTTEENLSAAIDRYLQSLPARVRSALGYLCVFEPLNRTHLAALAGAETIEEAARVGAMEVRADNVYSGHPLLLERLATLLPKSEIHGLQAQVATQLATTPSRTPADRLGRTLLALQGGVPIATTAVVAAANEAMRLGDHSLAERLARGALDQGEDFDGRMALSSALAWQGRGRESDTVLAGVDLSAISEEQLMEWALPRAANQFWMLSEPERATTFLHNIRGRVSAASSRVTLDALSATFAMNAGNLRRAVDIAAEVISRPDAPDMAVAWAASATALASARMGRFDAVEPAVRRVLGSDYPGVLRFTFGLAEVGTSLMAGRVDDAEAAARTYTDFAESVHTGRAIGDVLLAHVLLVRGDAAGAELLLGPASTSLARTGYSWGPLSLMLLTIAQAYQGEVAESAKTLARTQSLHGTKSAMFAPELGVARAWRLATIGDRPAAITAARDAARTAKRSGQFAVAVWALHEATRLGDRRAGDAIAQIADSVPCMFTDLALTHARALTAGGPSGLIAAADALAAAGFRGAAADARRQAGESVG